MIDWPFKFAILLVIAALLNHLAMRKARKEYNRGMYVWFKRLAGLWWGLAALCVVIGVVLL